MISSKPTSDTTPDGLTKAKDFKMRLLRCPENSEHAIAHVRNGSIGDRCFPFHHVEIRGFKVRHTDFMRGKDSLAARFGAAI